MSNTSVNIKQLKEMHSKLQNLNTNVSNAIGRSREFHSKLEGKLQESLSKLQENLDQSINTDRVNQNDKILLDIHSHFEQKCSQIEEQNLNLVKRLRQMEKQEEDYKSQINLLNSQLLERGLQQIISYPQNFSFKANNSQQSNSDNQEFTQQQLEESFYLKQEIDKLNKEIEVLIEEKKKIIDQQEQNQQYLHDHQIACSEQLTQSELSTGSKNPCKANPINAIPCQQNNLQNLSRSSSPLKNQQIENHQIINEEHITRVGNLSPQNKPRSLNSNLHDGSQIRLISPTNSQMKNSIHSISPTKIAFTKSQSANNPSKEQEFRQNNQLNITKQELEHRLVEDYEAKLQQANKQLRETKELQEKQSKELLKERDIRIQMQIKLEELEAEKRYQNIQQEKMNSGKMQNVKFHTSDSLSSPNMNQTTICQTPLRNQIEKSNEKQYKNENSLGYSASEYTSPNKIANKQLNTTNSYTLESTSNQKFQPIHTTLKLNKNPISSISNNESNYTYQMSVSPNKRHNNQDTLNRTSQDSSQVQQQLIQIISKLQNSMSNKKKQLTPIKNTEKQIETAKKFENAFDNTLSQLKSILVTQENQQQHQQQTYPTNSTFKQDQSQFQTALSYSNPGQNCYNNSVVYTTEFNSTH
ncbi:hypothetical protein TTHERM_00449750 (macronuclear) [Tetrahymena thermophila SB210]|uniref:Uncharacterized protein n=1 Tax=Tetrahymena thermophila (strain SB210) TaxID=312017 RepID=Q238U5_TETTS|nr:hypothetical protein TTHERM_00449750 [Tetrahymena thermophila SB210]EAR93125.1 hypothetical protein TTHERM_00449750 [Tetrahymena thermophila SB210]|eukprot:XP_001013370.1 hypothetical protein TTHERM_00449750 [Tetrahymena thermophila SB210]